MSLHVPFYLFMAACLTLCVPRGGAADERLFTYSYEADTLPEGEVEFEQWVTARFGREGGDFARWDFREELEYGITDRLTTAIYLNFRDTYFSPDKGTIEEELDGTEFSGVSSEWKYQLLNPYLDPLGLLAYGEFTTDGEEIELEEKLVAQKNLGDFTLVANATIEQVWEFEHGETIKEGELELTAGVAYKVSPQWSAGIEGRNLREYANSFTFDDEIVSAWFLGPVVHYGAKDWWVTTTVLPQIGDRNLDDRERVEVRVLVGVSL